MNVMGTVVLQPAGSRREFIERILPEYLNRRLPLLPPLRRRLVQMPLETGLPVWVEDSNFECANHISNARLPAPGGERQLAAFVAAQAALPLHRSRPMWELSIVDGLAQRRVALVFKFHHSAVDGISCAAMLGNLLDASPSPGAHPLSPQPGEGVPLPSAPSLLINEIAQWPRRLRLLRET